MACNIDRHELRLDGHELCELVTVVLRAYGSNPADAAAASTGEDDSTGESGCEGALGWPAAPSDPICCDTHPEYNMAFDWPAITRSTAKCSMPFTPCAHRRAKAWPIMHCTFRAQQALDVGDRVAFRATELQWTK